jgi:hypothetical protein
MDQVGKVILMGSAGETYIHLHQVEFQFGGNEKVNPEIHFNPRIGYIRIYWI